MNFEILKNLPVYNLDEELNKLLESNVVQWHTARDQICINTTKDELDNYNYGRGSLWYDWDKAYHDKNNELVVPTRKKPLFEKDFSFLCTVFVDTLFEEVYRALEKNYVLGRVRIMNLHSKNCLTWHKDNSIRVHYPIKTQEGCLMIIDNEVKHLEKNTWYRTNTLKHHTVLNGSKEDRLHLVATVLEEK